MTAEKVSQNWEEFGFPKLLGIVLGGVVFRFFGMLIHTIREHKPSLAQILQQAE